MQPISLLIFSHLFSQHLMDIMFLYLHMGRPPQERHILWYVFSYSSHPAVHLHKIDLFTIVYVFLQEGSSHDRGLYARSFEELFDLSNSDATSTSRYSFSVSVIELYNEQVTLCPHHSAVK